MNFSRLNTPQRVSAIAIAVVALAAFLPWVSLLSMSKNGIDGDGSITLAIAIIGAVVLLLTTSLVRERRSPGKVAKGAQLVAGVLVALIGIVDMNGVAAIGLYLTFFAGVAWVVGAAWDLAIKPAARGEAPESTSAGDFGASDGS